MLTNFILTQLQNPDNRKIVNEWQDEFAVEDTVTFTIPYTYGNFEELTSSYQFSIIRHCINLLPCFDERIQVSQSIYDVDIMDGTSIVNWGQSGTKYINVRQALLTCGAMSLEELEEYATDNNLIPTK